MVIFPMSPPEADSPRIFLLDVLLVRLVENPCAALHIEKIPYSGIENRLYLFLNPSIFPTLLY